MNAGLQQGLAAQQQQHQQPPALAEQVQARMHAEVERQQRGLDDQVRHHPELQQQRVQDQLQQHQAVLLPQRGQQQPHTQVPGPQLTLANRKPEARRKI